MKPLGLWIGDWQMTWHYDGRSDSVPTRVGTLTRWQEGYELVDYLLVGDETGESEDSTLLHPRRAGYRWTGEQVTAEVLRALLARVRQSVPPGESPGLVLAVPYWVQRQGEALEAAARAAGWAKVTLVTDLYALALAHAADEDLLITVVTGADLVDVGAWRLGRPLAWLSVPPPEVDGVIAAFIKAAGAERPRVVTASDSPAALQLGLGDLPVDAVARAAAAFCDQTLPTTELSWFVETATGTVPVPGSTEAPEVWRALRGGGAPTAIRLVGRWELAPSGGVPLWETTVRAHDPLLLHIQWESHRAQVCSASGEVLAEGRLSFRSS